MLNPSCSFVIAGGCRLRDDNNLKGWRNSQSGLTRRYDDGANEWPKNGLAGLEPSNTMINLDSSDTPNVWSRSWRNFWCFHGLSLTVYKPEICGDCVLGPWRISVPCTVSCGGGTQTLIRDATQPTSERGKECPGEEELTKVVDCNPELCPGEYIISDFCLYFLHPLLQ